MASNHARLCGPGLTSDSLYHQLQLTDRGGIPISRLAMCPPIPANAQQLGLSPQGVSILPRYSANGAATMGNDGRPVYDIWDWVGASHYEFPSDFFMEVNHLGFSRKIPKTAQVHLLGPNSVHFLLHEKALIDFNVPGENAAERGLWQDPDNNYVCIRHKAEHAVPKDDAWVFGDEVEMCTRLWFASPEMKQATSENKLGYDRFWRHGVNNIYQYEVFPVPDGTKLNFKLGRFMWFPLGEMVVTKNAAGNLSQEAEEVIDALGEAGVTPTVVDINDLADEA